MPKTRLQFAFQGGGARLGPLLAAAHGTFEALDSEVEISCLSGTSAGAIAATVLATRRDPEIFRARIRALGKEALIRIARPLSARNPKIWWDVFWGNSLYNSREYKSFLHDIFIDRSNDRGRFFDFSEAPPLYLPYTNLRMRKIVTERFDPNRIEIHEASYL